MPALGYLTVESAYGIPGPRGPTGPLGPEGVPPIVPFSGTHLGVAVLIATSYLANAGADALAILLASPQQYPIPARTARNLRVKPVVNALLAGMTVTVLKNGVATALEVVVPAGTTAVVKDTTHSVAFAADDRIDLRVVSTGGGVLTAVLSASLELGAA